MLQEKLYKSRVLMKEVSKNKQKDVEHKTEVKKNNTFFDAYTNTFVPILQGYTICKNYNHVNFSDKTKTELKKLIVYSKETFEKKDVIAPDKYKERVEKLKESIASEWKSKTDDHLADIKDKLGILKLVSKNKQEIQKILNSMNGFSEWPTDENASKEFDKAAVRAKEILDQMKFDDEIVCFLRKVKDRNASLLDLSDSIIAWIRKENLSANIMLSIKN